MLPDLHTGFSRGRSGGLVFLSLSEFSTVYCDNHDGVITHVEPDILECEVKWALGSITMNKASGGDGIQLSYFKS